MMTAVKLREETAWEGGHFLTSYQNYLGAKSDLWCKRENVLKRVSMLKYHTELFMTPNKIKIICERKL